jgi:hypothetical protein
MIPEYCEGEWNECIESGSQRRQRDDVQKHPTRTAASDANSALAYKFWLARCFRDGSPEEDLFRAICVNSMKSGVRQPPSKHDKRD